MFFYSDGGVTMLQDGNNTLYPLVRNSTQTFTDPRWFELLPVQSIAARSESLATVNGPTTKHKVSVVALAFKVCILLLYYINCTSLRCLL